MSRCVVRRGAANGSLVLLAPPAPGRVATIGWCTSERALVYGMAVTGEATARAMLARGWSVVAADDRAGSDRAGDGARAAAMALGIDLVEAPDRDGLAALVREVDLVAPSPGVPEDHPVVAAAAAAGTPVVSELDLAYDWEQDRPGGPRPMVAVTGTDGKTTTTLMATAMIEAGGRKAVAAGNTELPLVAALDLDVDCFVVECSSFRLAWTERFRSEAAVWLNLAPDHLNWHRSLDSYEDAKARIWAFQRPDDAAIGHVDDPIVRRQLAKAPGRTVTFGLAGADYRVEDGELRGPHGPLAPVASLRRRLPHDLTNALAAAAGVLEASVATVEGVGTALAGFVGPRHRIELVASADGVDWYDDSKATTPHAATTAVKGFPSVVLIAGGRNKGLDLTPLAAVAPHLRAVVAIGEAASEVAAVFATADGVGVEQAGSMPEAVKAARRLARAGDAVVLSPACASFDWYGSYGERGDDFARSVRDELGAAP